MKHRRVYSTESLQAARQAMAAARSAGVEDADLSLVARADIELDQIPDGRKEGGTDFGPALVKGAGIGGATGLLAGLAAVVIPPFGVTLAGAAAMTAIGAAVGSWSAALMGSTVPDPVRRKFEDEIEAGNVLLVVEVDEPRGDAVQAAVVAAGARPLPYSADSSLT